MQSLRHVIASVLIFVVLSGSGMLVGIASATDEATIEGEPFTIAEPLVGDRGRYELEKATLTSEAVQRGFSTDRSHGYTFEVMPGTVTYDADGKAHWTWEVQVDLGEGIDRHFVDVDTFEAVAGLTHSQSEDSFDSPGLLASSATRTNTQSVLDFDAGYELPCGLIDSLHRSLPPIDKPVDSTAQCDWGANAYAGTNRYHIIVRGVTEGVPLMVVDFHQTHPSDVPKAGDEPEWRAWYAVDVPYPVRMEDLRGGLFGAPGDVLRLTGFDRGTTPIARAPPLVDLPPLEYAPLTDVLLDETGFDHPWPLSEAVQYVLDDPLEPYLRDFLRTHPDAYLGFARHAAFDTEDGISQRWEFRYVDGSAQAYVRIAREEATALPMFTYDYEQVSDDDDSLYPRRSQLPDQLPTIASMMARWEILGAGTGHPAATPAFEVWMYCDALCETSTIRLGAGTNYYYHAGEAFGAVDEFEQTWMDSMLYMEDGRMEGLVLSTQRDLRSVEPVLAEPPQEEQPPSYTPTSTWSWPEPATAATIAGGALLMALLYYFSPLLKTGFIGLFSRVRHDQILEHPQRRMIMDTISEQPGIHLKQLLRETGQQNGAAKHHLDKLLDARKIAAAKQGGYTCYFPAGKVDHKIMHSIAAVKSDGARALLRAASLRPGSSVSELAQAADVRPQTAHYHVKRLKDAGLIETIKQGAASTVIPTAAARQALALT